jgi:hypothetical protein
MVMTESAATALAHLEMIFQAATGDYSPKKSELEKRKAAVVAFIQTGQCVASDEDKEISTQIHQIVTSHLKAVNE